MQELIGPSADEQAVKEFMELFFSEAVVEQISYVMGRCESKVKVIAIVDGSFDLQKRKATMRVRYFLEKLAQLTDMIEVHVYEKNDEAEILSQINTEYYPTIALFDTNEKYSGVCFHGFPGGHELEAFILAIYNVSGPGQPISNELKERIDALSKPLNLKICVSLHCLICLEVVEAANRIAILNQKIRTATFDIECFTELTDKYEIPSIPAIIINDDEIIFGRRGLKELLGALGKDE